MARRRERHGRTLSATNSRLETHGSVGRYTLGARDTEEESMHRRHFVGLGLLALSTTALIGWLRTAPLDDGITVYRTPTCGCCLAWVDHLRESGFAVSVEEMPDLAPIKRDLGVPEDLESCHTATVGGYVVEGHVPAEDIRRLLASKPNAKGLAVPGMPIGSPGMERGNEKQPYRVILFGAAGETVFATH